MQLIFKEEKIMKRKINIKFAFHNHTPKLYKCQIIFVESVKEFYPVFNVVGIVVTAVVGAVTAVFIEVVAVSLGRS